MEIKKTVFIFWMFCSCMVNVWGATSGSAVDFFDYVGNNKAKVGLRTCSAIAALLASGMFFRRGVPREIQRIIMQPKRFFMQYRVSRMSTAQKQALVVLVLMSSSVAAGVASSRF